jgi:4-aminobutyrate aminotransferase-like enzyme
MATHKMIIFNLFNKFRIDHQYCRGIGMLMGVEIVIDKESRKPNKDAAELLVYKYVYLY